MKAKFLFVLCVATMIGGCTRTLYLPTETRIERDTNVVDSVVNAEVNKLIEQLRNTATTHEKVIVRDSVVEVRNEQGDVIIREVYKSSDRDYSEKELIEKITMKYDSIFNEQKCIIDSLSSKLAEVPVPIEKPLTKWQQFKMNIGTLSIGFIIALLLVIIIWLIKKFRK